MPSAHNFRSQQAAGANLSLSAAHVMTRDELQSFARIIVDTAGGAVQVTLPAVASVVRGLWFFMNKGANALTIICADGGFGGSSAAGDDTCTLSRGDLGIIVNDGSQWHANPVVA